MTSLKAPKIFDYLDLSLYLKDYYLYRKSREKGFSYESWAAELDFNSRSFLRMMVIGKKKLTPKVSEAIQKNNFSEVTEQIYFFFLVKYSQASSAKEKQVYSQKMMQILRRESRPHFIENEEDFISDPIIPRLLSLLGYEDLDNTVPCFSKILKVPEKNIHEGLNLLKKLGLVHENQETQTWTSSVGVFKVPDGKGKLNLRKFHEKSLREALDAFDLPKESRSYKSLLLPMTEAEYQVFLNMLDEFSNEQVHRCDSNTYGEKRLYQANFNIYQVGAELNSSRKNQI